MKLMLVDWLCFGREDILEAFSHLGYSVVRYPVGDQKNHGSIHEEFVEKLAKEISRQNISLVFSMNYFPSVSESCNQKGVPYVSWIYDNPQMQMFFINIINECNFLFTFNHFTYRTLRKKGVKTIYYMPMAVNAKRLQTITLSAADFDEYGSGLSFVGAFYHEKTEYYQKVREGLLQSGKAVTAGYLEALCLTQLNIYGTLFLKECLKENQLRDIIEFFPYENPESHYFTDVPSVCASYVLARQVTRLERMKLLTALSDLFLVKVCTYDIGMKPGKCMMHERTEPYDETPKVFKASKINLNISLRSIETGIPLRAFDIMGAGGFLMTNYQEDFMRHFEPDRDFVFYESEEDLIDKCRYYLKHDSERNKIAQNGLQQVLTDHTYEIRIAEMIRIAGKQAGIV